MNILIGSFGQGIFIFIFSLLIPILYFIVEIVGCSVFALFKKILKRETDVKKVTKEYIFSLVFRAAVILIACIVLSLISQLNYNRIMSNPYYNNLMQVDKMDAIFANINNEDNGLNFIFRFIITIGLPFIYVLNVVNTMINHSHRCVKFENITKYVILFLNGMVLAFMCYLCVNAMMGI